MVFEFKKKQAKSENHEIYLDLDLMISYMEAMVKIEHVSHNLSCMMFTSQSILEEESYHWEGFGKIWSQRDDQIGVWLQNFLDRQ